MINEFKYKMIFDSQDKIFIATSVDFPEIKTHGNTKDEALKELNIVCSDLKESSE